MPSGFKVRAAFISSRLPSTGEAVGADAGPDFLIVRVGGGGGDLDLGFEDVCVGGVGHGADYVEDAH